MKSLLISFLVILSLNSAYSFPLTPKIQIAPGHLCTQDNPDFDRFRYKEGIPYCNRNVSSARKDKICAQYGVSREERMKDYTVDHIIPLSLGGSNDDKNLWCQHRSIYTGNLEFWLYKNLDNATMRQVEAVHYIMAHKFNPDGKDHIPLPPNGQINSDSYQEQWEAQQKPAVPKF